MSVFLNNPGPACGFAFLTIILAFYALAKRGPLAYLLVMFGGSIVSLLMAFYIAHHQ